jgi:hypothetical protein
LPPRPASHRLSDEEFEALWVTIGPAAMARRTGQAVRGLYEHRKRVQRRLGRTLVAPPVSTAGVGNPNRLGLNIPIPPGRVFSKIDNGIILVGSDCHYWPGKPTLMHKAFVAFCKEFKPAEVILNGDVVDMCKVSRHPPLGWTHQPSVQEEIEVAQERLHEIEKAAGRARKRWPVGNHDERFEVRIATFAPEYAKVAGTSLKDHFPLWEPCYTVFINDDIVVLHNWKGGKHAPFNNTLNSGRTTITGHLHNLHVRPFTDWNGTRWGVDCGMIADPNNPQFEYNRDRPLDWREGFCVLTFKNGVLLQPELVLRANDNAVQFRGQIIRV